MLWLTRGINWYHRMCDVIDEVQHKLLSLQPVSIVINFLQRILSLI